MSETKRNEKPSVFYSDLQSENMVFARLIGSPARQGILKSIACPDLPDGYHLITAKNFPGKNSIKVLDLTSEIFCSDEILYEGQPLALLVGSDKHILDQLSADIQIEEKIDTVGTEVIVAKHIAFGASVEEAFADEENRKFEERWKYRIAPSPSNETNGALVYFEGGKIIVNTPTQWSLQLVQNIAESFGVPEEKIVVNRTINQSHTTGNLWGNTLLVCQAVAALLVANKPVQIQLSHDEQERLFSNAGEVAITYKTALKSDGKMQAVKIDIEFHAGAFNPFAEEVIDRLLIASCSIYSFESLDITARALRTPTAPASININTIDAAAFFAVENQIQKICALTSFLPDEIRIINSDILDGKKSGMPFLIGVNGAKEALNGVISKSDFRRKFCACKIDSEESYEKTDNYRAYNIEPRGVGFACAYDASGYYGTSVFECDQKIGVTLREDGRLLIHAPRPGAVTLNIWKNIAAEILEMDAALVDVDADFDASTIPHNFYSNISIMTSLLKNCCEEIQQKKAGAAFPLTVSQGIPQEEIAQWDKTNFKGVPFFSTSFIAIALDVRVDPCSFRPKIEEIWLAVSAGKILAAKEAESRIKFAIQKTLAELMENEKLEARKISIYFVNSDTPSTRLEGLVNKALPAAFSSAISQALNCTDRYLPIETNSLYQFMEQSHAKREAKKSEAVVEKGEEE